MMLGYRAWEGHHRRAACHTTLLSLIRIQEWNLTKSVNAKSIINKQTSRDLSPLYDLEGGCRPSRTDADVRIRLI